MGWAFGAVPPVLRLASAVTGAFFSETTKKGKCGEKRSVALRTRFHETFWSEEISQEST
jgi:hypothetical protein